jgi:hypothetical protein
MANINNTVLTCNNMQRFKELMTSKWNEILNAKHEVTTGDDDSVFIKTRWGIPEEEIMQLSKESPDLTFTAEFSFEADWYSVIHRVEYKNGQDDEVEQRANYMILQSKKVLSMVDSCEKLLDQAENIFKRIDFKLDEKGRKMVFFLMNEIVLTVEDDAYLLKVSKIGSQLEVKECFRKVKKTTTELIPITTDDSLPF